MESAPFAGVVLCCTSIPVDLRTDLANKVTELGGIHKNDLTHEVTHLIVGDYNTPKYRHVARDRPDIKAMCAGWVDAVRDPWTRDAPIDFPALEAAWRLKTFEVHGGLPGVDDDEPEDGATNENGGEQREQNGDGPGEGGSLSKRGRLLCSVTGFEEEDRQAVIALIVNNGGVYSGDLTRAVTHLIVNKPEGKKYNAALHWNIRTVAIEWLHDSVSRGMILDETKYDPRLPPHERGKDAWVRNHAERTASILGKRLRDAAAAAAAEKQSGQRKLRKTTSQKLSVQRDDLWGDILGKPAQPSPAPESAAAAPEAAATVSRKSNTPAPESSKPTNGAAAEAQKPAQRASAPPADAPDGGVLSTSIFCIHGFSQERTDVLAGAVATMGGSIATSLEQMAILATRRPGAPPLYQHVIVPQEERPELHPAVADNVLLVTEFFIERCLHKKQYAISGGPSITLAQQPSPGTIGRPFPVFPIPGFDALSVCSSGFTGVDLNQIDKTVRQLGAKYEERFTAQCSVLVVTSLPAVRKQKLELALSWKVPVVDDKWLSACIASGTLVPVGAYLFPQLRQNPGSLNGPAVRPPTAAKPSNDLEPTMALTVPTLVVASPRTLHVAAQQNDDSKAKNKNANGKETDLDLTAPYDTAPSRQDVNPQTSSAAASAVQRPHVNNPFRDDSESPPSQRPSSVVVPPEPVPAPPQLQQQQPKPRQPFNRVLSEIADSAAGDSSDGLVDSDDGGGASGSTKVSPLKQLRQQRLQQQQQQQQSKPLKSASTSTTMKRSSTTTAAPTTTTPTTSTTAASTAKPIQRPVLSRVLSDVLNDGLSHHHKPAIPIGISIGDLMKDTGAPAKPLPALQQQQQPNQQALQHLQQPHQQQHLQKNSPFGRSHSSVSGMSVPENDGPASSAAASAAADTSDMMPPTQIQVQYLDPEAERMREQLMRKIRGGAEPAEAASERGGPVGLGDENAALRAGTAEEALAEARHHVRRSSRLR